MPVKTDRLLHLLVVLFGSYWLLKHCVRTVMRGETGDYFTRVEDGEKVEKYRTEVSFKTFINDLQEKEDVLDAFIQILKRSKHKTYFFETPSIDKRNYDEKMFEFVLVDAPSLLNIEEDSDAFKEYFSCDHSRTVVSFKNLGGDATLVSPCPELNNDNIYSSLAPFTRKANENQVREFWRTSAAVLQDTISDKPTWMSTSGVGIFWLHLRLDSRPKYYTYTAYTH